MGMRDGHRAGQRVDGEAESPAGPSGRVTDPFRDHGERAGAGQDTCRGSGDQGGQRISPAADASWVGEQVQKTEQADCIRQRDRCGNPGQLVQRGGHERRCRSRHGLAKRSWDFDTHVITETVPALRLRPARTWTLNPRPDQPDVPDVTRACNDP